MTKVKVGDKVTYEVAPDLSPRWYYYEELYPPTGKFVEAEVLEIKYRTAVPTQLKVLTYCESTKHHYWCLLDCVGDPAYPGYISTEVKCECGADAAAIGGNAYGAHSFWCPKHGR